MLVTRKKVIAFAMLGLAMLAMCSVAAADSVTFSLPSNSKDTDHEPIAATVTVTTVAGGITIQVTNNIVNPTSQGQIITGLQFALTGGSALGSSTLNSITGKEVDVNSSGGGYVVDNASPWNVSTSGWQTQISSGNLAICAGGCGTWKPEGIIGLAAGAAANGTGGLYSAANPSISGDPHSPELAATPNGTTGTIPVTFKLLATGVTSNTSVSSLLSGSTVIFGTSGQHVGATCTMNCTTGGGGGSTPEPGSMILLGTGIAGLVAKLRRKK